MLCRLHGARIFVPERVTRFSGFLPDNENVMIALEKLPDEVGTIVVGCIIVEKGSAVVTNAYMNGIPVKGTQGHSSLQGSPATLSPSPSTRVLLNCVLRERERVCVRECECACECACA